MIQNDFETLQFSSDINVKYTVLGGKQYRRCRVENRTIGTFFVVEKEEAIV